MSFSYRINDAINRASFALNTLSRYDFRSHPRSEPNARIRNDARLAIDPATAQIRRGVDEGRWEGVSGHRARQALRGADLLSRATWDLSDLPEQGRPTNVGEAQRNIRDAIDLLSRSRW